MQTDYTPWDARADGMYIYIYKLYILCSYDSQHERNISESTSILESNLENQQECHSIEK